MNYFSNWWSVTGPANGFKINPTVKKMFSCIYRSKTEPVELQLKEPFVLHNNCSVINTPTSKIDSEVRESPFECEMFQSNRYTVLTAVSQILCSMPSQIYLDL